MSEIGAIWIAERTPAELAARLRAAGQRVTPQRLLILGALSRPGEHLTADEIYARAGPLAPAINRSTVYRTLELFRDLGVISETDLGGGVREFEMREAERHHHLICRSCGAMIELSDELIQPLRTAITERYGFAVAIDHLAMFGLCRECQHARDTEAS